MNNSPSFKVRARVLNQLGEQLIKNEAIALLELIKNSYDADASVCDITMNHPDNIRKGKISIQDDGDGMDYNTLATVWLEIGTSYKDDLMQQRDCKRSPKYKRLRLGEKGIGRFGVHRLGREIEIITRTKKSDECVLQIDWDKIKTSKYVEDLPVEISTRKPKVFKS